MAVTKMNLLRIGFPQDYMENALVTVGHSKEFHPELARDIANEGNQGIPMAEDGKYENYLNRLLAASQSLHCELAEDEKTEISEDEIEEILNFIEAKAAELTQEMMHLSSLQDQDKEALQKLKEYDIERLNQLEYVSVKFGRFPESSIQKLALHNKEHFIYDILNKNNHYYWIVYICLQEEEQAINEMFHSLFFEPLAIPHLDEEELAQSCEKEMNHIYGYIKQKAEMNQLRKYVVVYEDELVISGFVPAEHISSFIEQFEKEIKVQVFPADTEEGLEPPTILKNRWFFQPFELFVEMYGLPKYGSFDPVWFVGLTYCILFGMMFADLGQGFALLIIGLIMEKKMKIRLGGIIMRLAPFSMFFGLLFGSVFGDEHLLDPMFHALGFMEKPIHVMDPGFVNTLITSAIGVGVFLILSCILYNIIASVKQKNYGKALFDQNGLAGFIVYSCVIIGMFFGNVIPVFTPVGIVCGIVLPMMCILLKEPLSNLVRKFRVKPHGGWGDYFMESIFELLEVVLGFVSNTMSYLRVGGFVLSHAGMMLVVMTIKEQAGNAGIFVMIFGNIFVMALEGLIVGIQTLRLEYYEMFSRYYEGGGKKFEPITAEETN